MIFTLSVPCMKQLLSVSSHTKKTQPISAIFSPDVSFNCKHRKQHWVPHFLALFYPSKNTSCLLTSKHSIKRDSLFIQPFGNIFFFDNALDKTLISSTSCSSCLQFEGTVAWILSALLGENFCHLIERSP